MGALQHDAYFFPTQVVRLGLSGPGELIESGASGASFELCGVARVLLVPLLF